MADSAARIERTLDRLLPKAEDDPSDLFAAMRYAALGGGKRLRPFLVLQSASLFAVAEDCALRAGAAVECVHCYSLVHDDLPAMDDDDLRRGQPTTHKKFDEATAILAGDGLLTMAFEILADPETHADPQVRCHLVAEMAKAAGYAGMVGGQSLDMQADGRQFDIGEVTRLQRQKTGELFAFSCTAGAILGRADGARRAALHNFAHDMGLAFQIADDLLDVEGTEEEVGKPLHKDASAGKATFVSILGRERAKAQAQVLVDQAIGHLDVFDNKADTMRQLARFVIERRA